MTNKWRVSYKGFLQTVVREFPTHKRAMQWLAQVGKASNGRIHTGVTIERVQ